MRGEVLEAPAAWADLLEAWRADGWGPVLVYGPKGAGKSRGGAERWSPFGPT